jgi:aspartate/methionine/tyrosine aminotransferase
MMSISQTKKQIILDRDNYQYLHSATLSPVQKSTSLDLSTDHPNYPLENSIIEGTIQALEAGQTHYVDVPGVQSLRESISVFLNETGLTHFHSDIVQVAAGMQECRFLTIQNIADQHHSLGLPDVVHPGVRKAVGVRPIKVISLPVDYYRMLPTIEGIRQALEGACKMIFLESPSRLTGAVYTAQEVQQIGRLVKEYAVDLLWDQGLSSWVIDGNYVSLASVPDIQENVTIMGELWPGTGLERFYLGYIAGPEVWMKVLKTQKQVISICTNAQIQFAAIKALPVYREKHHAQLNDLSARHQKVEGILKGLKLDLVEGSTVNFIAFRASTRIHEILSRQGYQFVDGKDFGAGGVIRLSVTPDGAELHAVQSLKE